MRMSSANVCWSCNARLLRQLQLLRQPPSVRHLFTATQPRRTDHPPQPPHLQGLLARYRNEHNGSGRYSRYQDPGISHEDATHKEETSSTRDISNAQHNRGATGSNSSKQPYSIEELHQGSKKPLESQTDFVHTQPGNNESKTLDQRRNKPRRVWESHIEINDSMNNLRQDDGTGADNISKPSHGVDASDSSTMGPVTKLAVMMKSDLPFSQLWAHFNEHFMSRSSAGLQVPTFSDMRVLSSARVFKDLMWKALDEWSAASDTSSVPDPLFVFHKMVDLGFADEKMWPELLWSLTFRLMLQSSSPEAKGPDKFMRVIEVWRQFFFRFKPGSSQTGNTPDDWSFLPKKSRTTRSGATLDERLRQILPSLQQAESKLLASASIAIMSLVLHERTEFSLTEAHVEHCWPLIAFLAEIIGTTNTNQAEKLAVGHGLFSNRMPKASAPKWKHLLVNARLDAKMLQAEIRSVKSSQIPEPMSSDSKVPSDVAPTSLDPRTEIPRGWSTGMGVLEAVSNGMTANSVEFLTKRAFRATESGNLALLQDLWREAMRQYAADRNGRKIDIPEKVYREFLKSFMTLKNPSGATSVWNTMMQSGFRPTDRIWTTVLAGCASMQDYQALEGFWKRMLDSGHEPSSHAWTARIYGTITMGRKHVALKALDYMGRAWVDSVQRRAQWERSKNKDSTKPPVVSAKPVLETINAALSGLTKRGNRNNWEDIDKLRQWAKAYGIQANAYTYNPLIRFAFLTKNPQKAFELIAEMEKEGIEADGATFTILIRNMFEMSALGDGEPPKAIEKRVRFILQDLKSRKLLNRYTSAALVDGLAKQKSMGAIQIILNEIDALGQSVPAPVFTILSTYYFEQNPPNIEAANTLWSRAIGPNGSTDLIFFDNMIKGYAACGEIGKMGEVLLQMSKQKKPPGWGALVAVVEALYKNNDMAGIAALVKDVRKGGGLIVIGARVRSDIGMQERFWQLAEELGLKQEEVEEEQQPDPHKKLGSWMADKMRAGATPAA